MKRHLTDITNRRQALLGKIDNQRMEVAALSRQWQKPLAAADLGLKAVRYIRAHPGWVIGSVTLLLVWRRKGLFHFAQMSWRNYPVLLSYGLKLLPLLRLASRKPDHSVHSD